MTCRLCGYEASYDAPACPRCGALAGAVPRPRPQGTSGDGSWSAGLGQSGAEPARGGLVHEPDEPDEPRAVERTINRAALRAELARGGVPPAGLSSGGDIVVPPVGDLADGNGGWGAAVGDTAYLTADAVAHLPEPAELGSAPDVTPAATMLGPSFSEGDSAAAPTPATIGERFLANVLDGLVLTAAMLPFGLVIVLLDTRRGFGQIISNVLSLAFMAAVIAYATVPIGRHGRTIGKNAMRIEVQDVRTGGPIGVGMAFARWLVLGMMGAPCYLGYLSVFFDKSGYHRGWHDSAASSRVVKATTAIPVSTLLKLRA